jgi:hypothetical protein
MHRVAQGNAPSDGAEAEWVFLQLRRAPALMPDESEVGWRVFDPVEDFNPFTLTRYLEVLQTHFGEQSVRVVQEVEQGRLPPYQAAVHVTEWRRLWDVLIKPFSDARRACRHVRGGTSAVELLFGVEPSYFGTGAASGDERPKVQPPAVPVSKPVAHTEDVDDPDLSGSGGRSRREMREMERDSPELHPMEEVLDSVFRGQSIGQNKNGPRRVIEPDILEGVDLRKVGDDFDPAQFSTNSGSFAGSYATSGVGSSFDEGDSPVDWVRGNPVPVRSTFVHFGVKAGLERSLSDPSIKYQL